MVIANNAGAAPVPAVVANNAGAAPVLAIAVAIPGGAMNPPQAANQGILGANRHLQRQQANIAAGNVGNPIVYPEGTRTRNPDQVDVLDLMNRQMMQGVDSLANLAGSLQPSPDERRRVQLEGALSSCLERMQQMTTNGLDTTSITARIARLQQSLDDHIDTMFGL